MPIGYLDVPTGADLATKRELAKAMYDAMHEHSLDTVAADGVLLADDLQRVDDQRELYSSPGPE